MGVLGWLRAFWQRDKMPDPAVDVLGAASLPHVVIDTRGKPIPEPCVALVAKWEGFREKAYLCPAAVWTIGYGTTRWPDGRKVKDGETVTRKVAETLLRDQLKDFAKEVDRLVSVPLTANERGALVSFTYNVGASAFGSSTLLKLLNSGDRAGAAEQFRRWNVAAGVVMTGLVARRKEEAAMFRGAA